MKRTNDNIEHRIQLKKIEIDNYKAHIVNYPVDRMQKCAVPYLTKLEKELHELEIAK
jgi:hypothetical protein